MIAIDSRIVAHGNSCPTRLLAGCLLLVALAGASGCVSLRGFRKDWNAGRCCAVPGDNLAGCWEGCWHSDCTGHKGKLKAIITRCDNGTYSARFGGTFFKVLPFAYRMSFTAEQEGDVSYFRGQKDLGKAAGGVYRFTGRADAQDFVAHYSSCKDKGAFIMRRRVPCCRH